MNLAPALALVAVTTFTSAFMSRSPYIRCTGTTSPAFSVLLCINATPPLDTSIRAFIPLSFLSIITGKLLSLMLNLMNCRLSIDSMLLSSIFLL